MIFSPIYLRRRIEKTPEKTRIMVKDAMRYECLMALSVSDELMSIDLMSCLRRAIRMRNASMSLIQLALRCSSEEARRLEYKVCKTYCRNISMYRSGVQNIINKGKKPRERCINMSVVHM